MVHERTHLDLILVQFAFFDFIQDPGQLLAKKGRHNSRRCLVGTQSVIVTGRGNGSPNQIGMVMKGLDSIHKKSQEHEIALGGLARGQKIFAGIGSQRPIVMLSRSVDARKGLFVQ